MFLDVEWNDLKSFVDAKGLSIQYIETGSIYLLAAFDGPFCLKSSLKKNGGPDVTSFENNYKANGNSKIEKVDINGVPLSVSDKGASDFDTVISHNWIDNTTWPATDNSVWMNEASSASKQLVIPKAEVQFTHDVKMATATTPSELYFDIWAYNPLFDSGQPIDPDDPTFVPGVSSGNPLRFLVKRNIFKGLKEVFDFGNDHYTMNASVDGLPSGVTTVRFDYDQKIVLRGDQGAQIRFSLKNHSPMEGGPNAFCTVSLVVREEDIPQ